MPAPLQIGERTVVDVFVLTLTGQFVADEGDAVFRETVAAAVAGGTKKVLIDLRGVSYMDSGGAGALAATLLHVTRRDGVLKLLCPSGRVCRVLEITHLMSVFDVFEDEASAFRSFE